MDNLTFRAHASAFVTSGYPDAIDYRKPTGYGAHLDVETIEEAKAIAARLPCPSDCECRMEEGGEA